MNDFEDTSDWEKLVALSDEELNAAIANQNNNAQVLITQASDPFEDNSLENQNQEFLEDSAFTAPEFLVPEISANGEDSNDFNFEQPELGWNYLLDQESTSNTETSDYPNWEQELTPEVIAPDWEVPINLPISNDAVSEAWVSDEVNTEFMKEWEESAAKIAELTGIDLSQDDADVSGSLSGNLSNEISLTNISAPISAPTPAKAEAVKFSPPTSSDESGPLPPLPVLPPRKVQSKKNPHLSRPNEELIGKYNAAQSNQEPSSEDPKPSYHFDQLAAEICESDEFSWTNLNQNIQSKPQPKSPPVWNSSEKIVVDLDEEEVESTAIWNYNPPESFTENDTQISEIQTKPTFDLKPAFSKISKIQVWKRFKLPIIAIASIGGLFALYSIPFVQRGVTELGLKSQLLKDASAKDLSGMNFEGSNLERVNFNNAILKNVNFKKANLSNASLNGSNLKGANFSGANLRAVDLRDSQIELQDPQKTRLSQKDLLMWQIVNKPLVDRNLSRQNLDGFFLGSAQLKKSNFNDAKLRWVNFANADLTGASFIGADLTGVNFVGANLIGANFMAITWNKHKPKTTDQTICPNGKKGPCKL